MPTDEEKQLFHEILQEPTPKQKVAALKYIHELPKNDGIPQIPDEIWEIISSDSAAKAIALARLVAW